MHLFACFRIALWILCAAFALAPGFSGAHERPFAIDSAGEGREVYLIPGLSNAGDVWEDLAERLRAAGYRTHVLTLAGFGGRPPLSGEQPFLPNVREHVAQVLAQSKSPKPVVIGHSLGGFLAFWLGATESRHLAGVIAIDGVPYMPGLAGLIVAAALPGWMPPTLVYLAFMAAGALAGGAGLVAGLVSTARLG